MGALAGNTGGAKATYTTDCMNDHYFQFGFYSTGTPRWNRDLVHNNQDLGVTPKHEQVTLYGMKTHMHYQFGPGSVKMATDNFYGNGRDTFTDLNSGMGTFDLGYSVTEDNNADSDDIGLGHGDNDGTPQMTTSVIAGENGAGANTVDLKPMIEHAEKYAYIGPSAGCSVTEVDRGTHESSECSGRGNCDYSTGTCLCDAGYTLEACSEQTVLV